MKSIRAVAFGVTVLASAAFSFVLVSWPANAGGVVPTPIPEPATAALFAAGLVGMIILHQRRRRKGRKEDTDDEEI